MLRRTVVRRIEHDRASRQAPAPDRLAGQVALGDLDPARETC